MSKVFICAAIPDEQAIKEEGAVAVATAIEAGDERRARAKFHWQFLEHYPAAQDCAYKFLVCEDKPGIPRPALDSWDAEYMQENRWDEESASFVPVETESDPMNVTFDKLAPEVQNAVMVKFDTCENITVDMVISAQELLQEDMATFDGHIVEALMKMPEVNAMYPELKLHAIGWVKHKCKPGAKWPEIQAEMRIWKKRREGERKETGKYTSVVDLARARANQQYTENSTGKISPVIAAIHREYKQTWKTLDDELAYALWPGEVEPSVEREGPFYFLFTDKDGEKYGRANKLSGLDKALAAGATEITKEEYFARKNGTYTGSQQNTDASDTTAQPDLVKVTADEVNKIMQAASISQPDANKLLAASRGEFVEGISDPNDPKWVKGIETRDSVHQNQSETEQYDQKAEQNSQNALQNEPETKQPEPVVQQEEEKVCTACNQTGGGNCPDCGAVMGDATYQETFNEESQDEAREKDPEEIENAGLPNKECTEGDQHANDNNEIGETANPLIKVNSHRKSTSTSRLWHHLMIDLETMGKNPDAPIISIDAIFFDPQTGDMGPEFSKTIDLETAGGVIDRDVIKRWLKQSREAQSAIMTDEIPLDDALLQLREFIDENSGEFFVQVWGNGANFENTILRRSYERQGIPCPWRYYNDRDVRTIVELGKAIDFDARTAIPFEGERHNALDDARYQAKYVSVIWQKLIPNQADF
ncbi:MAG: 3'-5' exoribonuclease [Escherichia coli]